MVDLLRREDVDDPALVHDGDPIAEGQDLVELARHDEHGRPGIALLDDAAVDVLDRTDVEATRRLGCDDELVRSRELARGDDLLLVAARQIPDVC